MILKNKLEIKENTGFSQLPPGVLFKAACSLYPLTVHPHRACQLSLYESIIAEQVKSCQSRMCYFQQAPMAGGFEQPPVFTMFHLLLIIWIMSGKMTTSFKSG
jgi:hypothetical protein